jgi:hypothetical protein
MITQLLRYAHWFLLVAIIVCIITVGAEGHVNRGDAIRDLVMLFALLSAFALVYVAWEKEQTVPQSTAPMRVLLYILAIAIFSAAGAAVL